MNIIKEAGAICHKVIRYGNYFFFNFQLGFPFKILRKRGIIKVPHFIRDTKKKMLL